IAWAFDPDADAAQRGVLADSAERAAEYADHFVRVGVASLTGYTPSREGLPQAAPPVITPAALHERGGASALPLVDVRTRNEYAGGTVPGAQQLSAGKVLFHTEQLPSPEEGPIVTFCQSGLRNAVAASALRRAGFDVIELEGSYSGWERWKAEQPGAGADADADATERSA